jgi:hypothetical protein
MSNNELEELRNQLTAIRIQMEEQANYVKNKEEDLLEERRKLEGLKAELKEDQEKIKIKNVILELKNSSTNIAQTTRDFLAVITPFDGKTPASTWLKSIEKNAKLQKLDQEFLVNNLEKIMNLSKNQIVVDWYHSVRTEINNLTLSDVNAKAIWEEFSVKMRKFFSTDALRATARSELLSMIYEFPKSPRAYITKRKEIILRAEPFVTNSELIRMLKEGLPMEIRQYFRSPYQDENEFASALEEHVNDMMHSPTSSYPPSVSSVQKLQSPQLVPSVSSGFLRQTTVHSASQMNPSPVQSTVPSGKFCHYCRLENHVMQDCYKLKRRRQLEEQGLVPPYVRGDSRVNHPYPPRNSYQQDPCAPQPRFQREASARGLAINHNNPFSGNE